MMTEMLRQTEKEILLSGFDDHDTHHAFRPFTTDESGAIYMAEGVIFYIPPWDILWVQFVATNGGFYRYQLSAISSRSQSG